MHVCAVCTSPYPGRAGRCPFLFYGSRSNTARALIAQNVLRQRAAARSRDEELRAAQDKRDQVLAPAPPIGHGS